MIEQNDGHAESNPELGVDKVHLCVCTKARVSLLLLVPLRVARAERGCHKPLI